MSWDTDPMMELEALEDERRDADMEQAEWERQGRLFDRAQKAGRCTHSSGAGYVAGKVFYPEQEGLKPGQIACTEHTNGCNAIFNSDEEKAAATEAALNG